MFFKIWLFSSQQFQWSILKMLVLKVALFWPLVTKSWPSVKVQILLLAEVDRYVDPALGSPFRPTEVTSDPVVWRSYANRLSASIFKPLCPTQLYDNFVHMRLPSNRPQAFASGPLEDSALVGLCLPSGAWGASRLTAGPNAVSAFWPAVWPPCTAADTTFLACASLLYLVTGFCSFYDDRGYD